MKKYLNVHLHNTYYDGKLITTLTESTFQFDECNFNANLWKRVPNIFLSNFFIRFVHLGPWTFLCKYINPRSLEVSCNLFVINIFYHFCTGIFWCWMVYVSVLRGSWWLSEERRKCIYRYSSSVKSLWPFLGHKQSSLVLQDGPSRLSPGSRGISGLICGNAQETWRWWSKLHKGNYFSRFFNKSKNL